MWTFIVIQSAADGVTTSLGWSTPSYCSRPTIPYHLTITYHLSMPYHLSIPYYLTIPSHNPITPYITFFLLQTQPTPAPPFHSHFFSNRLADPDCQSTCIFFLPTALPQNYNQFLWNWAMCYESMPIVVSKASNDPYHHMTSMCFRSCSEREL